MENFEHVQTFHLTQHGRIISMPLYYKICPKKYHQLLEKCNNLQVSISCVAQQLIDLN